MGYQITIDSSQIDSDLTNFPILVVLNSDNLTLSELAVIYADPKKVSFKDSDENDCYAEIESALETEIRYHAKVSTISSTEDTIINFAFGLASDNSYIGATGEAAAQAVWSNGFEVVYHMAQDPSGGTDAILDSTDNENHGTSSGTMTSDDLVYDEDYGYCIDFDGSNDYIVSKNLTGISGTAVRTISAFVDPDPINFWGRILALGGTSALTAFVIAQYQSTGNYGFSLWNSDYDSGVAMADWELATLLFDGTNIKSYVGATNTNTWSASINTTDTAITIAATTGGSYQGKNKIGEVRVSSVVRSAAWIAAEKATLANTLISIAIPYKISGSVTDNTNNALTSTVNLHDQSTGVFIATTTSDEITGEYSFENISLGTYYIVAFADGYRPLVFSDVVAMEME